MGVHIIAFLLFFPFLSSFAVATLAILNAVTMMMTESYLRTARMVRRVLIHHLTSIVLVLMLPIVFVVLT